MESKDGKELSSVRTEVLEILEEAIEIEHHLHNRERWYGKKSSQTATQWGETTTLTAFRAISGNNAYGTDTNDEALVLGSADTPAISGKTKFDLHRLFVTSVSEDTIYKLRIIYGTGTMAAAIAANQYSEVIVRCDSTNPSQVDGIPFDVLFPRMASGTQVWVQAWNVTDNATIDFLVGIHEYDE